jgi:Ca2+-binding RTX toxin-like protein
MRREQHLEDQSMAITASFSAGALSVLGDNLNNKVKISRNAAGRILVNDDAVAVTGGTPTVANTSVIQIFGLGGDDAITLDESNGALPAVQMFGGAGNDTLTGGSGADQLFGQAGNDVILGKGGNDLIFGGAGNDVLTGGDGDDQVFGEGGNDRMIWNPGDDTDLFEGGDGTDTAEINGGNGAEVFQITANGTRVRFDRLTPAPFSIDIGTTENLVLNANGGDDVVTAGNGLGALIKLTIDGGAGNDTITGGDGADVLIGGDGNDAIIGGRGNDTALLGAGDDTFIWNPGDGNDVVEGQAGSDTLVFNGANINERIDISTNGGRARFTRDIANIVMDLDDVERIQFTARAGADVITVGNLAGTDVKQVDLDLAGNPGTGDGAADQVIVNATAGNDQITVAGVGTSVAVTGLAAQVTVTNAEAGDLLLINAGAGNDTINAATLAAGIIGLTIDAGAGNDTVTGSQGRDVILGGDGNDTVTGGRGDDVALLGAGNDTFIWNPGDGNDVVEGQAGNDTLVFNGANVSENIDIFANGGRALLTRNVANVVMDLDDIETIKLATLGGVDNVVVSDLSGTDVKQVAIDLAATAGSGQSDGAIDTVTVNGSAAADTINVGSAGTSVVVNGLPAQVTINGASNDALVINGGVGDDVINATALAAGRVSLTVNGGAGNDVIFGSQSSDLVNGGTGNDTALLGAGNDVFVWNPGDGSDIVEGQAGFDTLRFNGANISENIDISANGGRVRLTRNVANITMDVAGTEAIDLATVGGVDTVTINDMTGTALQSVNVSLGANGGDGAPDTIVINATNGDDVITVTNNNGLVTISGLATTVNITGFEAANDRIVINGLGGDDVITASGVSGIRLTANGGDGDDILLGSAGNDVLSGGAGDDVLIGGGGLDVLDGGPGNNVVINSVVGPSAALLGQFMASTFVAAGTGSGGTPISEQPAQQQPLLAQPHA